ncbi:hypothetical protein ASG63_09605 [Methylobacterium sp. Leaf94]|uniref:hypothetical protein n=1 Tax=Methylobacterium sp. Leaf94 TaxID=1736250 RepID=UPI0006FBD00B|nr:hypothetical protein [Methylobacterium sp. Leaf94]KQU17734.1 hypothetical protein ASG63_09605 [Methylobacterium sp. Leaf94]
MTISWPLSRQQVLDDSGRPLLVPSVNFYAAGTTASLTVYKDAALSKPWTQPVKADGFGRFPRVYLPAGQYREEVLGPYGDLLWNDDGLGEAVASDTGSDAPVDPTAIAVTGDIKWRLDASIQAGWVRMNARTIGGSGSGASELANVSAKALFLYLWNTFPDAVASVIGGRGVSAIEDFAAGRQIMVPTMQGLIAGGLDDMGSNPADRLQTSVQLTLAAGSATATVSRAERIGRDMTILADGVPAGTTVVAKSGSTITMSAPAAVGTTGTVSARFSYFPDAQTPGGIGGDCIQVLSLNNLPADLPDGAVEVSYPEQQGVIYSQLQVVQQGSGAAVPNVWTATTNYKTTPNPGGSKTFGVPISNPDGGVPHRTMQPTRLGTFYIKL